MALAVTSPVATVADTSDVEIYTTASFTPTANSLLVVFALANGSISTGIITGGSLTWTLLQRRAGGGDAWWIWWAQVGSSPSSMTITVDITGDPSTGCFIKTFQVTGHDTTTPVAQYLSVAKTTSANPVLTLGGNMNTNNCYLSALYNGTNPFAATPPTGWTETDDTGFITPNHGITAAYRINGETGTTVTFTAISSTWHGGFAEIAVATAVTAKSLTLLGVG